MDAKPLNVLLTNKKRGWNGEAAYVVQLALGLTERGHRVVVATRMGSEVEQRLAGAVEIVDLHLDHARWFTRPRHQLEDVRAIRAQAIRIGADLLHCNASWDTWLAVLALRDSALPRIRTRHNLKRIRTSPANRYLYGRLISDVIAASETIRGALEACPLLRADRIHTVQYGIPLERFDPARCDRAKARRALREEIGAADEELVFAFVSRLSPRKNPRYFLDTARLYLADASNPAARFLFVGEGAGRELRELASGEPRIAFLGMRRDVPEILAGLDAFVLCSTEEPFGMAAVEAMAMECPVVLARRGGFLEMIEDRVSGDFFEIPDGAVPGEPCQTASRSLLERLRELAREPELRRSWARAARRVAVSQFSATRMVDDTIAVYRAILAREAAMWRGYERSNPS
jgi:glycosyltransferase involved in cell wall biosynthesis